MRHARHVYSRAQVELITRRLLLSPDLVDIRLICKKLVYPCWCESRAMPKVTRNRVQATFEGIVPSFRGISDKMVSARSPIGEDENDVGV